MKMSAKQYAKLWHESLNRVAAKDHGAVGESMLRRILKDGSYRQLPEIVRAMEGIISKETPMEDVTIISARPLEHTEAKRIVSELLGHDGFSLRSKQDASLIGGLIVQTRDQRWDLSLKRQIRRLHTAVTA